MFKHKKSLGQHFLKDLNIVKKIAECADIQPDEQLWEIGPGQGVLTTELLKHSQNLRIFEIDNDLYEHLELNFPGIDLVKKDILKYNWSDNLPAQVKLVANLPYQITTPVLFKICDNAQYFQLAVIMIQKEVAVRMKAKPGTKDYGILSLKIQYFFDIELMFKVPPHVFVPQPKVDSAVVRLTPRKNKPQVGNLKSYWLLIETSFRNRRKMLRNNLRTMPINEFDNFSANSPIDLNRRGESLCEEEFVVLHDYYLNYIGSK